VPGSQLYKSVGIEHGGPCRICRPDREELLAVGAPHVAIVTTEAALGVYGAVDSSLYVDSFPLAARRVGLDAIPQAALAVRSGFRDYFNLPETRRVVGGISFG
jgi:nitroreductase